jgi:hypothetical protein
MLGIIQPNTTQNRNLLLGKRSQDPLNIDNLICKPRSACRIVDIISSENTRLDFICRSDEANVNVVCDKWLAAENPAVGGLKADEAFPGKIHDDCLPGCTVGNVYDFSDRGGRVL